MGYTSNFSLIEGEAFRYNSDGTLDTTFANQGIYVHPQLFGEETAFRKVAIQQDGKLVISGRKKDTSGFYDLLFVRLNDDGSIDSTFSTDGIALHDLGSYDEELTDMIIQPDGKIIAAGRYQDPIGGTAMAFVC